VRDLLGTSAWVNRAPKNRTQTIYTRFIKGPSGELKSGFTESQAAFKDFGKDALKTRYSEYWESNNG
jgi:hypothetical protein